MGRRREGRGGEVSDAADQHQRQGEPRRDRVYGMYMKTLRYGPSSWELVNSKNTAETIPARRPWGLNTEGSRLALGLALANRRAPCSSALPAALASAALYLSYTRLAPRRSGMWTCALSWTASSRSTHSSNIHRTRSTMCSDSSWARHCRTAGRPRWRWLRGILVDICYCASMDGADSQPLTITLPYHRLILLTVYWSSRIPRCWRALKPQETNKQTSPIPLPNQQRHL